MVVVVVDDDVAVIVGVILLPGKVLLGITDPAKRYSAGNFAKVAARTGITPVLVVDSRFPIYSGMKDNKIQQWKSYCSSSASPSEVNASSRRRDTL